jgi:hypothetical protein
LVGGLEKADVEPGGQGAHPDPAGDAVEHQDQVPVFAASDSDV